MNWSDALDYEDLHEDQRSMIMETAAKLFRSMKTYSNRDGGVFSVTDDPEKLEEARQFFRLGAIPYVDAPGGKQKWEVRGWHYKLWPLGRQIAHEQSVAKGFTPSLVGSPREREALCSESQPQPSSSASSPSSTEPKTQQPTGDPGTTTSSTPSGSTSAATGGRP